MWKEKFIIHLCKEPDIFQFAGFGKCVKIHASHVKGYFRAAMYYSVCAVCGVGLCDTDLKRDRPCFILFIVLNKTF